MGENTGNRPTGRKARPLTLFLLGCLTGVVVAVFGMWLVWRPGSHPAGEVDTPVAQVEDMAPTQDGEAVIEQAADLATYPYSILGEVVDPGGHPIPGALVEALNDEYSGPHEASVGDDGTFEITNVPLALFSVAARAEGFQSAVRDAIAPGGPLVHFILQPAEGIGGQVTHEGQGITGVRVFLGGPGLFPAASAVSAEGGRFYLPELPAVSQLEVVAVGSDLGNGFGRIVSVADPNHLDVELRPAIPLLLEVKDAISGAPVDQGVFTVSSGALRFIALSGELTGGRGRIDGLPGGSLYLEVQSVGHVTWEGTIAHDGSVHSIELHPGSSLSGRVLGSDGTPVPDARLVVTTQDASGRQRRFSDDRLQVVEQLLGVDGRPIWPPRPVLGTSADGRFSVAGLPAGRVVIGVSAPGYRSTTLAAIDVADGRMIDGIEVRLEREVE